MKSAIQIGAVISVQVGEWTGDATVVRIGANHSGFRMVTIRTDLMDATTEHFFAAPNIEVVPS